MFGNLENTMKAISALQSAMEHTTGSNWFGGRTTSRGANPPINVFEKDDSVVVVAELPGVNKEDIVIQVKDQSLRLSGKREIQRDEGTSAHRLERRGYEFDRSLNLPFRIDADHIEANYRDGVLALVLPRAAEDKPHTVAVN